MLCCQPDLVSGSLVFGAAADDAHTAWQLWAPRAVAATADKHLGTCVILSAIHELAQRRKHVWLHARHEGLCRVAGTQHGNHLAGNIVGGAARAGDDGRQRTGCLCTTSCSSERAGGRPVGRTGGALGLPAPGLGGASIRLRERMAAAGAQHGELTRGTGVDEYASITSGCAAMRTLRRIWRGTVPQPPTAWRPPQYRTGTEPAGICCRIVQLDTMRTTWTALTLLAGT